MTRIAPALLAALLATLSACGSGYSWDEGLTATEKADHERRLLTEVANRRAEAIEPMRADVVGRMSDDEIIVASASLCKGLADGLGIDEMWDMIEDNPDIPYFSVSILGPASKVLCPDVVPVTE